MGKYAEDYTAMCKETPRAYAAPRITQQQQQQQQDFHVVLELDSFPLLLHVAPAILHVNNDEIDLLLLVITGIQ